MLGRNGPVVGPAHDRRLLTLEGFDARVLAHLQTASTSALSASRSLWISTGISCSCASRAPSRSASAISSRRRCRSLRRVGARAGVEQRQPRHPLRRLAHDLAGDVAAHGQAREGEPLAAPPPGSTRAMPAMVSWRVWSATVMSAMSPSAAICGAHNALVHSRPGTSTRFVFRCHDHAPAARLSACYPPVRRTNVPAAVSRPR